VALITHRREELHVPWAHALVTEFITEHGITSSKTTSYHFPLYLQAEGGSHDIFKHPKTSGRQPNLNPKVVEALKVAYERELSPEEIFYYIYAVLYAPCYREKYAHFLRRDFPSIPFTAEREVFEALAALGKRLVELHLLKCPELDPPLARFEGKGDGKVSKGKYPHYEPQTQRVYINLTQYFAPVPPEVWEYRIGGYQVCHKWLKERREHQLSLQEIRTYCHIITVLARTLEIQQEIDEIYPAVERQVLEI